MGNIRILFFACILLLHSHVFGTPLNSVDTAKIYKQAKSAPFWINNHPSKLARYVSRGLPDEASKVLAISYWISKNIKYTYTGQEHRVAGIKTDSKILRTKKATSLEYAKLFKGMCAAVDIQAEVVHGYIKEFDFYPGDTLYRAEYTWNVVRINKEWYILDLTLAGNNLEPKTTFTSKILWALFKVPSSIKIQPKKQYSPQWLNVKPDKAIRTHLPILQMYQLLQYPISIDVFQREDSVINEYVQHYPQKTTDYSELDKFTNLSYTDKFVYTAERSVEINPFAHLTSAFYYFYAVQSFKNTTYLEEKERIFAPIEQLKPMLQYSNISDSLFLLSIADDARELKAFQNRSEGWKRVLTEFNRIHQVEIQELKKLYLKEIQQSKKLISQNSTTAEYIDKNTQVFDAKKITAQPRPTVQKNTDLYEGMKLLEQADSIQRGYRKLLFTYDSIVSHISRVQLEEALRNQKIAKEKNEKNTRILNNYIIKKGNSMPMVYPSNKAIEKRVFTDYILQMDSLNRSVTDTVLNFLTINQPILIEIVKEYNTQVSIYLKTLESAKAKLYNDAGEDNLYEQTILEYVENLTDFKTDFKYATYSLPEIIILLESEIDLLDECSKFLKKDNTLEMSRHKQYMEYRKKFKTIDVEYIKYFQTLNRDYKKLIQKALK